MVVSEWDPIGLCPIEAVGKIGQPTSKVRFQDLPLQVVQQISGLLNSEAVSGAGRGRMMLSTWQNLPEPLVLQYAQRSVEQSAQSVVLQEVFWRSVGGHASMLHEQNPAHFGKNGVDSMGDDQESGAFPAQIPQGAQQLMAGFEIQGPAGFIQNQHAGVVDQSSCDHEATALAIRELPIGFVCEVLEIQLLHQHFTSGDLLFSGDLVTAQSCGSKKGTEDQFFWEDLWVKSGLQFTVNDADAGAKLPEIDGAGLKNLKMRIRFHQWVDAAVDQVHECALACSIWPQNCC